MVSFTSGIKEDQTHRNREQKGGCQELGVEEMGQIVRSVQIFIHKKKKVWGCMYSLMTTVGNTVFYN